MDKCLAVVIAIYVAIAAGIVYFSSKVETPLVQFAHIDRVEIIDRVNKERRVYVYGSPSYDPMTETFYFKECKMIECEDLSKYTE